VAVSCEHCNEPYGSIKGEKFLDQMSGYQFLKKNSASSNYLIHCDYASLICRGVDLLYLLFIDVTNYRYRYYRIARSTNATVNKVSIERYGRGK
jgi:hypothetical protein